MDNLPSCQNTPAHISHNSNPVEDSEETELEENERYHESRQHNNETVQVDVQVGTTNSPPPPQYNTHNNNPSISSSDKGTETRSPDFSGSGLRSPDRSTPLLNQKYGAHNMTNMAVPPRRAEPMTSPRTHLRETTKDIVTAVTHHDINGMNTVSTVALKDIDVQMSQLSGYETYV